MSEVLKIIEGALKANGSLAANYAGLLADKLASAGEFHQARLIRDQLARAPKALAFAQDASKGVSLGHVPVDGDSRLNTVDVSLPSLDGLSLFLPSAIQFRVDEFLESIRHHDILARAGAALPARLLVYGAPGTGKTMMARWIAAHLNYPLLTVRCDTLVSSMLGQTSRNLRRVFDYAQQAPSVLFLDEFDALASARGNERDVGELQRVVIALLQNMDALPDSAILVAATNHEQLLDPAIWRRFSFRIPMPLPDGELRLRLWKEMLGIYAPKRTNWGELTELSNGSTGAVIQQVCLDAKRSAILQGEKVIEAPALFRRLGLMMRLSEGKQFSNQDEEIRWLREWMPKRFSLRVLAKLYGTTVRQIMTITGEISEDGDEEGRGSSNSQLAS
ncbi:anti-phage ATPase IteA [Herbaspirillum rubrisubalbicans]|nr:anti-phage ATPase IteA [Herbaspirillum rubrisubalbicans]